MSVILSAVIFAWKRDLDLWWTEPTSGKVVVRGEQLCEVTTETSSGAPAGPRGGEQGGQAHYILHFKCDMSSKLSVVRTAAHAENNSDSESHLVLNNV